MRLPKDDQDGALSVERVLRVLRNNGVVVQESEPGTYLLSMEGIYEVQLFEDRVTRKVIQHLARLFGINTIDFYYPNRKMN